MPHIPITIEEFESFRALFESKFDYSLEDSKYNFLGLRLNYLLKETNSHNFSELYRRIKSDKTGNLLKKAYEAVVIDENIWFEDKTFWSFTKEILMPVLIRNIKLKVKNKERIWFLYSGSGQMLYAFAMYLHESIRMEKKISYEDFFLLATDSSPSNLFLSISARFDLKELKEKLPVQYMKYFDINNGNAEITNTVKKIINFRLLELKEKSLDPAKNLVKIPKFDFIYIKNKFWQDKDIIDEKFVDILTEKLYPQGIVWFENLPEKHITRTFEKISYLDHFYYKLPN